MKIDDDVVVHFDRLLKAFHWHRRNEEALFCKKWSDSIPRRNPNSKWFVPKERYAYDLYPPYCDGSIYLMGRKAVQKILIEARISDEFPMEDVFYTGILASAAGVPRVGWWDQIIKLDEFEWNGEVICYQPGEPVTFAASTFRTNFKKIEAFNKLKRSFLCRYFPSKRALPNLFLGG
ncbi:hypothetical protein Q1695_002589 [Nippostrongylus brasiliensis]|nr:hypothetical protein Q1695_002589 [Nippostrongylus brasiliensis]